MFRFVSGCVVGAVLLAGVAAAALYVAWGYLRPAATAVSDATAGLSRLAAATDLDRALTAAGPYDAPASGALSADQVARFLRVQEAVRTTLGARGDNFVARYRALPRGDGDAAVVPSLTELGRALTELPDVYLDAWRAQVTAMNAAGFSRDEYSWVRRRVYQAAGLDAVRYDAADLERAIAALARGARLDVPPVTLPDAPPGNRALVAPHLDALRASLPMAAFGL